MKYMLAAPDLSGNEAAYVNECLATNWISSKGRFIPEFEAAFARFVGTRHAIATCNGTVALHLALLGLGLGPGDEVIVPSLTYVATANAVTYCGARPVFADSDPETWCISPASIERLIGPRTRGIVPVHLYGQPCAMDEIREIARRRGLWVLEDCAEATGSTYDGRQVGSLGACAMFSFFGNKVVTTGEGGMVVTDDDALADRLRLLRGQGMDPHRRYWFPVVGYNFRMTNIEAAIGLGQIERIDKLIADRRRLAAAYRDRLATRAGLTLSPEAPRTRSVFWLFCILVPDAAGRDPLMAALERDGIETRPFFYPLHTLPMYAGHATDGGCPVAVDLAARGINLPTSSYLADADVAAISDAVLRNLRP
ncbi:MAG TPA: DegT/DnrJ/EryC1/StrS family aminotransferase [Planctomycetota bacterium]|nr:DegT/DnrJ/EryC1/StrS family aminotransferase [Planctomycetota bacterium]